MNSKNKCYTYFRIVGDFAPEKISKLLNLTPQKSHKTSDLRADGTKYNFAVWEFGECSEYDIDPTKQMEQTISLLQDKIDILNHIRKENDVSFVLQIVPTVYENEPT
ncbi:MAG: DUF4279 domain-containing protein, partial [Oscillospiraceae bacterium]|nr:DUF4279 domain-containing protein [Oscillospiraceae bacterium]